MDETEYQKGEGSDLEETVLCTGYEVGRVFLHLGSEGIQDEEDDTGCGQVGRIGGLVGHEGLEDGVDVQSLEEPDRNEEGDREGDGLSHGRPIRDNEVFSLQTRCVCA